MQFSTSSALQQASTFDPPVQIGRGRSLRPPSDANLRREEYEAKVAYGKGPVKKTAKKFRRDLGKIVISELRLRKRLGAAGWAVASKLWRIRGVDGTVCITDEGLCKPQPGCDTTLSRTVVKRGLARLRQAGLLRTIQRETLRWLPNGQMDPRKRIANDQRVKRYAFEHGLALTPSSDDPDWGWVLVCVREVLGVPFNQIVGRPEGGAAHCLIPSATAKWVLTATTWGGKRRGAGAKKNKKTPRTGEADRRRKADALAARLLDGEEVPNGEIEKARVTPRQLAAARCRVARNREIMPYYGGRHTPANRTNQGGSKKVQEGSSANTYGISTSSSSESSHEDSSKELCFASSKPTREQTPLSGGKTPEGGDVGKRSQSTYAKEPVQGAHVLRAKEVPPPPEVRALVVAESERLSASRRRGSSEMDDPFSGEGARHARFELGPKDLEMPSPRLIGEAVLPSPRKMSADAPVAKRVSMMLRAFRAVVAKAYPASNMRFLYARGGAECSRDWPILARMARELTVRGVAPMSWIDWSIREWTAMLSRQERKVTGPPPIRFVFSPHRLVRGYERYTEECWSATTLVSGPYAHSVINRYLFAQQLVVRGALPKRAIALCFPEGYERACALSRREHELIQRELHERADAGEFLWAGRVVLRGGGGQS